MLLQSVAIGAKKLLVDDEEICLLDVVCKVTYCFFVLRGADWPTHNFLGMYCYITVIRLVNVV